MMMTTVVKAIVVCFDGDSGAPGRGVSSSSKGIEGVFEAEPAAVVVGTVVVVIVPGKVVSEVAGLNT